MRRSPRLLTTVLALVLGLALAPLAFAQEAGGAPEVTYAAIQMAPDGAQELVLDPSGAASVFHTTTRAIQDLRQIDVPGGARVFLWNERSADGDSGDRYAVTLDGVTVSRVRATTYEVLLRRTRFDPLLAAPDLSRSPLRDAGNLAIVQFVCPPLEGMRRGIEDLGGEVHNFFTNHCHVVRMSAETCDAVRALPYVRWVGSYHPDYRTEQFLLDALTDGSWQEPMHLYVQVLERGLAQKRVVADRIRGLGGEVVAMIPEGFRLEAMLTAAQMRQVLTWDEVLFVDRWSAPESDMDNVRELSGANYLESVTGWTGQGVRAEVMDGNVRNSHQDLQSNPVIFHGPHSGDRSHGTPVTGIVFGDGTANPQGRGLMPNAQPIFADYELMTNRYTHSTEIVAAPYFGVFQTNSWGGARTRDYTSTSMEMDDIIFTNDLVILNSQSNAGNQDSRPQAWAKNIVSIGGIRHYDTLTVADDAWNAGGSIGPAADGRLKPDLAHFYDSTFAPSGGASGTGYTQFGGTSGATPITAGHFGLFFQMWDQGIFGNPAPGATVFDNRPHCTLAKAFMINTATQWSFSGAGHDLTRVHQGWGRADVRTLYDLRDSFFYVDETDVLTPMSSMSYQVYVAPGQPAFKSTMVYLDAAGTTSAAQHRINDLSMRVTDPMGTIYWGNNGLDSSEWSASGGTSNTRDTVENVFVQSPASGLWTIQIFADEINQDTHTETPALDADFALVVSIVEDAQAGCSATTPASPTWGDASIDFTTFSAAAMFVDATFEWTSDGGATWQVCTAAPTSPVASPAMGLPVGMGTLVWDTLADGAGVGGPTLGVQVRISVDDGVALISPPCTTAAFDVIPEPPSCTLTGPAGVATMDVQIDVTSASISAASVSLFFAYTLNGGATWSSCTPAVSSPLGNPAIGVPTGMVSFSWDSLMDGVGTFPIATGVIVRATVDDGISPVTSNCTSAPFDVDNVPPSPTCTITTPAGSAFSAIDLPVSFSSPHAGTAGLQFEYSLDGVTWSSCTATPASPLPNPAAGVPIGMASFQWDSVLDMVALSAIEANVQVRVTVDDGVAPIPGTCVTAPFSVDNLPPSCVLTPPPGTPWGGISIQLDSMSSHSTMITVSFEYSTDMGTSFSLCTTALGSAIVNPGGAAPVGTSSFRWDSRADGVGLTALVPGVIVRANIIDGVAPTSGTCATVPFDVDNTVRCGGICGDCDLNSVGPDVLDSLTAAQIAAGIVIPMGLQEFCCDVDSNARVDVLDSLKIAQFAAGLPVSLVCP